MLLKRPWEPCLYVSRAVQRLINLSKESRDRSWSEDLVGAPE